MPKDAKPERRIVSDTGPLISLEKLPQGYAFIRNLYRTIVVPPVVLQELAAGGFDHPEHYLQYYGITDLITVQSPASLPSSPDLARLDEGEVQAIALAAELGLPLLIEETMGRSVAKTLDIPISGIAGQVVTAHRSGLLHSSDAAAMITSLLHAGRISKTLHDALISALRSS